MQLTASAMLSDGTQQDVTRTSAWQSSNAGIARVSETGLVTIAAPGEPDITASYRSINAAIHLHARGAEPPKPTYAINGVVHEKAPTHETVIAGARIEVVGGLLNSQVFSTDATGHFQLPPVTDPGSSLKFKRPGYDDYQADIVSLPRDAQLDIGLVPAPGTSDQTLAGDLAPHVIAGPSLPGRASRSGFITMVR